MRIPVFIALLVFCLTAVALADVVHMTDGRKIKGKVVSETDDFVLLKGKYGEVKLQRHEIDHIEYGPVEEEEKKAPEKSQPKKSRPKPRPKKTAKGDLSALVDKAAQGDKQAAKKLMDAKRAALVPINEKLKEAEGEEEELLEKLRDEIEEKTQAEKKKAQEHYEKAVQIQKQCSALNDKMGENPTAEQRSKLSDLLQEMENELVEAFSLDPADTNIYKGISNLTLVYYHQRLYSKTMKILKEILLVYPEVTKKQEMLVSCYYGLKKYKDARKLIDVILKKDPDNKNAWAILGYIDLEESKISNAIKDFEKAVSIDGKDAGLRYNLGIAYKCKKKYDNAINCFKECLKIEPDHNNALLEFGKVLALKGNYSEAIEVFEQYCQKYPKDKHTPSLKKEIPKLKKLLKKQKK